MCRDVLASRELLGVAHGVQVACPCHPPTNEKGQTHADKTKWLLAIMCLKDKRLKQAYCDSDRFQVSPFVYIAMEFYSEGKCSL